jgi:hypothetical protein
MNQRFGVVGPSWQLVALAIPIAVGMGTHVFAADQIDEALSNAGKVWYEKYCMPCHGAGGAPGKAVSSATKEPVDLRTYVQRHGGKFPANDWLAVIADARPGGCTPRSGGPSSRGRGAAPPARALPLGAC